ncbi:hypothetical protein ACOCG7_22900 [Paraburkholderia sp. DD10]|uniref:hypothetical protein n=1 Tax=Paraburkholderia TaxID=1822464 RepID=UPI0013565AF5|nr:hypothetical protein [Paraburkholderia terricola]MDR6495420.1 hypothetical protein [Paraburkholderia terricola]
MHNLLEKQSLQVAEGRSKHQMHDVEDDWTNLPIDPPYSAQVTAESKALTGYSR